MLLLKRLYAVSVTCIVYETRRKTRKVRKKEEDVGTIKHNIFCISYYNFQTNLQYIINNT